MGSTMSKFPSKSLAVAALCAMCAGAIVLARIPLVVWGMSDPKRGGQSVFGILDSNALINRSAIVDGVCGEECREIIQRFFRAKR